MEYTDSIKETNKKYLEKLFFKSIFKPFLTWHNLKKLRKEYGIACWAICVIAYLS
jgi:hypothetical protein